MKDRILNCRNCKLLGVAAIAVAAAAPALAQDNSTVTAPAPVVAPPKVGTIGPGELSNFSLPGTVTKPADKPVAVPTPSPAPSAAVTKPVPVKPATVTAAPANARPTVSNNDLFQRPPTLPNSSDVASTTAVAPPEIASPLPLTPPAASSGLSLWPWAIALLAIVGGGLVWFARRRAPRQRYATDGEMIDIAVPPMATPRPDPIPAKPTLAGSRRPLPTTLMPQPAAPAAPPPAVEPRPDPGIPGAIVSTGLRPWIDVELSPDRALLDEQGAAIAFEVTLFNSGSAAARDVVIEAKLLNAGASQDVELSAFFTAEATLSDPIPQIAPYARIPLRSAVRLPREAISEYDYEGRKLFMPLVAISVRYRWSSGDGQSAAGFLVGQGAAGQEKLAPLRIDRGARSWNGLGARRYEKGVRR